MADWEIQRLTRAHDRSKFNCGQPTLNDWLRERAGQFERKDLARTFVATSPGSPIVIGYYALATHRVVFEALPSDDAQGLPRLDIPVVLLGRLAVDQSGQGKGLGAFLLIDALRRALHIADQIGVRAVEVDAIDEAAQRFYLKFGFRQLLDAPRHLFLPLHEIRKLNLHRFD